MPDFSCPNRKCANSDPKGFPKLSQFAVNAAPDQIKAKAKEYSPSWPLWCSQCGIVFVEGIPTESPRKIGYYNRPTDEAPGMTEGWEPYLVDRRPPAD
jgi:hypothetical protein